LNIAKDRHFPYDAEEKEGIMAEHTLDDTQIQQIGEKIADLSESIGRVFVGSERIVRLLMTGFVSGLHVLIEDVPGVGKTTLARSLAASLGLDFSRIQFTPDLLPGDIVGMNVWNPLKNEFVFKEGAIMHQFVLADEINRASPRTQSSLLEAMQEGSVTIDGVTHRLPEPFFVVATQNPATFTGSFHLPEGEIDRFGVSFSIGYPNEEDEMTVLSRFQEKNPLDEIKPIATAQEIGDIRTAVTQVHVSEKIRAFIIDIVRRTREHKLVELGASPRSSQHLQRAAQGRALMHGRVFVIPEDVIALAPSVLAHRLIMSSEAKMAESEPVVLVERIVEACEVPVGIN
jgi:MoxR-like ATPase